MVAAARAIAPLALLPALALVSVKAVGHRGIPLEIKLWDTGRTPLSHMVDVTNEFGLKMLAEHNFLNDNNIAFSPYGLMGILVALYEGVDGDSSYQIQRGMQLPWNRNIMRIGFRDIHRTLKTYFVPEEGFLAGLALNNDNVTFNESYKKILRFYGFDWENNQFPSYPAINNTSESSTLSNGDGAATMGGMAPESTVTFEETSAASKREETTTSNPNAETFNDIDIRMPTSEPTTGNPSALFNTESTTVQSTTNIFPTTTGDTTVGSVRSTLSLVETATVQIASEELQSTITEITTLSSFPSSSIKIATSNETSSNVAVNEGATLSTSSRGSTIDVFSIEYFSTEQIPRDSPDTPTTPCTTPVTGTEPTKQLSTTPDAYFTAENGSPRNSHPLERQKKSIVNFIFKSPPYIDEDLIYRAFEIAPVSNVQNIGGDQMFLANGLKNVQVSYMRYEAVLEHAFLPHLDAAALRVPLDSDRYYLLALLPARSTPASLSRLLARLARHSDLRDVYAALRPRRVYALLPSFTVKGHVILTADLQKLGIREVFEPRQHDFSPMTPQPGVYVRSVEQAVSVSIRKYAADDRNTSRYADRHPVHFSATYPFLYFVMDANIHVALMAGKNKKYQRTEKLLVDYMPTNPLFAAEEFTGHSALKNWTLLAEKGCTSLQQEGGVNSAYLQALRQMNKLLKELVAENRLSNRSQMKKPKCSRQSLLYQ